MGHSKSRTLEPTGKLSGSKQYGRWLMGTAIGREENTGGQVVHVVRSGR